MYKYGLEKEFFVKDAEGNLDIPFNGFPTDGYPLLVEARGQPADSIRDAVFLLMSECCRLEKIAAENKQVLVSDPVQPISRTLRALAGRDHRLNKSVDTSGNIYGYLRHRNAISEGTAGVHVSVTRPERIYVKDAVTVERNKIWDFAAFVRCMDIAFAVEIRAAKRNPGFYEIKSDGRIEYRSLPSNVDLFKVVDIVASFFGN